MNISELSLYEQMELLEKGEVTSLDLLDEYIKSIDKIEGKLNCFITKSFDQARVKAKIADETRKLRKVGGLLGIHVALKDNILTKGIKTTCASKILANYVPPYDAFAVEKLKDQGAIIIGKTNMDEFAMGSSTEWSAFGPTKNPWNLEYVPGGSSGGSAALISANLCSASLGTDTGGSIRLPSSFCGLVGLKPTYGRVSRRGLAAYASSLDQIGPITKNVKDSAIILETIAGYDPLDSTSLNEEVPKYFNNLEENIRGLKFGIPKEYINDNLNSEIRKTIDNAIDILKSLGATFVDLNLPHTDSAIKAYYIIASAEASSNLARYDGMRYGTRAKGSKDLEELYIDSRSNGFGKETTFRILIGTYVLSKGFYDEYYLKAQKIRTLVKDDFDDAFKKCDVILTPTSPTLPFKFGERIKNPTDMYKSDIFTIPASLAGLPAISIPAGFSKNKLPIGIQLIGKFLSEQTILNAAYAFESQTSWHKKRPEGTI